MSGVQIGSGRKSLGHKKELLAIAAISALSAAVFQPTAEALTWDPSQTATPAGSGGTGSWDLNATNTVWSNGSSDLAWTDTGAPGSTVATFGGVAGTVTVNSVLSTSEIVFLTNGYTIAAASTPDLMNAGQTANKNTQIIDATSIGNGSMETIDNPLNLYSNGSYIQTDGTITFNGTLQVASGTPTFGGSANGTQTAPDLTDPPADYILSAAATGSFEIGGGNNFPEAINPALVTWNDPTATDTIGGVTKTLSISYNGNLQANTPLTITGAVSFSGGTPSNTGDLRIHSPTFSGSSNINFNTGNTSTVAATAGAPIPGLITFQNANDNSFLINNVASPAALTIGSTTNEGTATGNVMAIGNTAQNGRVLTIGGTGNTIIDCPIEDSNQVLASNAYTNSTLAKNGTGTLTINSTGSNYKGATQIQNGTLQIGATNALPTGAFTQTGGTPGAVILGDVSGNTGTLDLDGNSQTVTSISLSQTSASALLPTSWSFSTSGSPFVSLTVAGLTIPVSGLAVGEVVKDNTTGFTSSITSIEDNGKSSATIKLSLAADPPATSGLDPVTLSTPATAGGVIGNSSTSSAASLAVNTVANANPLWNVYGGSIVDHVNGGTQPVMVTVGGSSYLSLTGSSNIYSGGTTVNAGATLFANNAGGSATGSGPVSIFGTLGGNGSISGATTVIGTVAPGSAASTIGTLSLTGGLTLGNGAVYTDDIDNAGLSDVLAVNGNLALGSDATLDVNVLDSTSGGSYVIATYSGSLSGTFATVNLPAGYSGIDYGTGTNSAITISVPEPASVGLLGLSALGLLRRRRRVG